MNKHLALAAVVFTVAAPAQAQHIDVLTQVVDGKLVTGAANYDNNTWLVGQQVFKRQLLSNFRSPDPGFTGLATGNPLLEPGVLGISPGTDVFFDIVPTTIDGASANFWWWDGVDTGDDGFTLDDVAFGSAPAGVTWNVFDDNFDLLTADGSDTVVPGAFIQESFTGGGLHNHIIMQADDSGGADPPEGIYLSAMVLRAEGLEDSDPFFFVHRTSGLTNAPRDIAATWVEDHYDFLVGEALPGDFNLDGVVDAADYTVWRDGLGVDFENADYDTWRDNYGAAAPAGSAPAAPAVSVPEPASVLLLATLLASAAAKRR